MPRLEHIQWQGNYGRWAEDT